MGRTRDELLNVTEKRNKKRGRSCWTPRGRCSAYPERAGIGDDREGPLVPAAEAGRHRAGAAAPGPQDPRRLVKKYCEAAGIDPTRLGGGGGAYDRLGCRRSISVHSKPDVSRPRLHHGRSGTPG